MQVAMARRLVSAMVAGLTLLLVGWASVAAQDPEVHRFFGFLGDVTVDGEPVGPGSRIKALLGDEVVGETVVNAAGAWILDVNRDVFGGSNCDVTFVINDLRAETAWETCTMRVRLALISPTAPTMTASAADNVGATGDRSGAADQSGVSSTESAAATESDRAAEETEDQTAGEMEEETAEGGENGEDGTLVQSEELVRPKPPATGTGGIDDAGEHTNWPRAAAVTAALTLVAALAALLISRRTDGRT